MTGREGGATIKKVFIVEDEVYVRDEIRYLLGGYDRLEVVGEADNPFDAICGIHSLQPDIVFLDIKLHSTVDGIALGRKIIEADPAVRIVFVTAFDDRAVEGFELGAVDYVLKPFSAERLAKTVERLLHEAPSALPDASSPSGRTSDKIIMKKNGVWKLVDVGDICYLQSRDHTTLAVTKTDVYSMNHTLRDLEKQLPPDRFLRTHKSFIVNLNCVHEIIPWFNYTYKIVLKDEKGEIPVSRGYIKRFKSTLIMA